MLKLLLSIIINIIILAWTGYTLWWFFRVWAKDETSEQKRKVFRYYTYNSNIFSAFASAVVLIAELMHVSSGQLILPEWVVWLRFAASSSVAVTMLTVVFFLAPHMGWHMLYKDDGLYMHTLGPILAILAFTLVEKDYAIHFPLNLLGASTVVIYAVIYLYQVVVKGKEAGGWPDFYGFNQVPGMWKASFPAMILAGCCVSLLLALAHNL